MIRSKEWILITLKYIALVVLSQWIFVGFKYGGIDETIVGRIINDKSYDIISYEETLNENNEGFTRFGKEVINWKFNVTVQMGIKRKAYTIGQYFDYLRLAGKIIFFL